MPELATPAVQQYTNGRLDKDDLETTRLLNAALATARRWCGWHVSPAKAETLLLDGPNSPLLALPTLQLVSLTTVVEDGVTLDVADLYWSRRGLVRKKSGARWSKRYGSISVTMTHGFDDATDFDAAVLSLVDRESLAPSGGRIKAVGPFQYDLDPLGSGAFTAAERARLEQFRLEQPA